MADLSVRPARPADAEPVADVQLTTWQSAYAELLPREALELPLEQAAAVWLHAVEAAPSPRHRLLVATDAGDVVGFASSVPATEDDLDGATTSELTNLMVKPGWGRRGHGSRLLAATVDLWREDGVSLAVTWVFDDDTAVSTFLESAGWAPEALGRTLEADGTAVRQRRWHTALG